MLLNCSQTSPTRAFLFFVCGQGPRRHVPPCLASWTNSSRAIRSAVQCEIGVCPPSLKTRTPGIKEYRGYFDFAEGLLSCMDSLLNVDSCAWIRDLLSECRAAIEHWIPTRHKVEVDDIRVQQCFGRARIRSYTLLYSVLVVHTFWFPCCRCRARCTS